MSPIINKIANQYGGKLRVQKIDVDKEEELADKCEVDCIPTMILLKD